MGEKLNCKTSCWNQINRGIAGYPMHDNYVFSLHCLTIGWKLVSSLLCFQQLFTGWEKKKVVATFDTQSLEGPLHNVSWIFTERNSKTMLFKATNNEKFVHALLTPSFRDLVDRLNIIIKLFSISRTGGLKMIKYYTVTLIHALFLLLLFNPSWYQKYSMHTCKS